MQWLGQKPGRTTLKSMSRILVVVLAVACCCAISAAEVLVADLQESELSDPLADTATHHSHRQKEAIRKALRQVP